MTEEMVIAAQRELPGVWNQERVRRALIAALTLLPAADEPVDIPFTLAVHLRVDEHQLRAAVLDAVDRAGAALPAGDDGVLDLAVLRAQVDGTPVMAMHEPGLNPALGRPLELGSLSDIGRRLNVARSTVTGWVKNREQNGMPNPVDGDAYDLREVEAWHRAWKSGA